MKQSMTRVNFYYEQDMCFRFFFIYQQLNGIVRDFTYTRLNLNDGGEYFVTIIACNGAKVCVKETSNGILVDNSPPITGNIHKNYISMCIYTRIKDCSYKIYYPWISYTDRHIVRILDLSPSN